MNRFFLWMLFCGIFFFVSCSKDDDEKKETIELSSYSLELWAGQNAIVEILNKKDHIYNVSSKDERVAKVAVKDEVITINTYQNGNTSIIVKDETIQEQVEINILSSTFTGGWRIVHTESLPQKIEIEIDEPEFEIFIKEEVTQYGVDRIGNVMEFTTSGNSFQQINNENKIVLQGKYSFENLTLILSDDIESSIYDITPISLKLVLVTYDMTDFFKEKYSQLEIKKVSLQQFWNMITF